MVAMAHFEHRAQPSEHDRRDEAAKAFDELVEEFGGPTMVMACLGSSIGQAFARLGGLATLRVIQVLIRQIAFSRNPQLEAECIAYTTGVMIETNATRIGERHGLTRSAISVRCRSFILKWNLPPGPLMKSEEACETYSLTNQPRIT